MKVEIKVTPNTIVTAEGDTHLDIFKQLSSLFEIFGEEKCLKCGGTYKYRVRTVTDGKKTYEYPELVCTNRECRAKLQFGQSEGGSLFPKRFKQIEGGEYVLDENGRKVVKGNWGWTRFNKETNTEE